MRLLRALLSPFNVIALLIALAAYGAGMWVKRPPAVSRPPQVSQTLSTTSVNLYFAAPGMDAYFTQPRGVQVRDNLPQEVAQSSLRAWVAGPREADGRGLAVVPAGSEVPQVWSRGQHYFVNLPKAYTNLNYGASGERMLLCSIAETLLAVRGQDVTFLVGGADATTLLGHMDLRSPYTRSDCDL